MPTPEPQDAIRRVTVTVEQRAYVVHIGAGCFQHLGSIVSQACGGSPRTCVMVRDLGVPEERAGEIGRSLEREGTRVVECVVRAGEEAKTLANTEGLLRGFAQARLDRDDVVVALGGGVVGDLAGFAASVYRRGVKVIQCPTTLLAMVDASVGGKTGVNLDLGQGTMLKNMIGTFHQPAAVVADVRALASLDDREFRAGLGECLKHAMIGVDAGDAGLGAWMNNAMEQIAQRNESTLVELVARNVALKARIVAEDPYESKAAGGRALLNLGHTFGHAIETLGGVEVVGSGPGILHGEAVALGLIAATAAAASMGRVPPAMVDALRARVRAAGLADRATGLASDQDLMERMGHDKKVRGGVLRVVLPGGEGTAGVVAGPSPEALSAGWAAIRA